MEPFDHNRREDAGRHKGRRHPAAATLALLPVASVLRDGPCRGKCVMRSASARRLEGGSG